MFVLVSEASRTKPSQLRVLMSMSVDSRTVFELFEVE